MQKNMSGAWSASKILILKFLRNCMLSYTEKITTLQSYFGRKYPKGFMGSNQLKAVTTFSRGIDLFR